jgi:hypothetical protein
MMPAPRAALDQRRLLQLLGMTGSVHDGEALTALRFVQRLVAGAGLTLVEAAGQGASAAIETDAFERGYQAGFNDGYAEALGETAPPWRVMRDRCLTELHDLKPRECEFLVDLVRWRTPTPRQLEWLEAIFRRCPRRTP